MAARRQSALTLQTSSYHELISDILSPRAVGASEHSVPSFFPSVMSSPLNSPPNEPVIIANDNEFKDLEKVISTHYGITSVANPKLESAKRFRNMKKNKEINLSTIGAS